LDLLFELAWSFELLQQLPSVLEDAITYVIRDSVVLKVSVDVVTVRIDPDTPTFIQLNQHLQ
jgi:hypothetical protein